MIESRFFAFDPDGVFRSNIPSIDYMMFNDWLESDVQGDLEVVADILVSMEKIGSGELVDDEFWGNDMVLHLDRNGAAVQPNIADEVDDDQENMLEASPRMPPGLFVELMKKLKEFLELDGGRRGGESV